MQRLTLEERLNKLERILNERSVFRGKETSPYTVWKFLMDSGPSYPEVVKDSFEPEKRSSITSTISNGLKEGCFVRQGSKVAANPNYEWDDVGVIDLAPKPVRKPRCNTDRPAPVRSNPSPAPVAASSSDPRINIIQQGLAKEGFDVVVKFKDNAVPTYMVYSPVNMEVEICKISCNRGFCVVWPGWWSSGIETDFDDLQSSLKKVAQLAKQFERKFG